MNGSIKQRFPFRGTLASLGLLVVLAFTGCQVEVGGQLLPSPYYMTDDVQYFAPGPEFKLAKEAAVQKMAKQQEDLRRR